MFAFDFIDEPRKLFREVVLLTDDRNLRVKALARDVPVREIPDFMQWTGLGWTRFINKKHTKQKNN